MLTLRSSTSIEIPSSARRLPNDLLISWIDRRRAANLRLEKGGESCCYGRLVHVIESLVSSQVPASCQVPPVPDVMTFQIWYEVGILSPLG